MRTQTLPRFIHEQLRGTVLLMLSSARKRHVYSGNGPLRPNGDFADHYNTSKGWPSTAQTSNCLHVPIRWTGTRESDNIAIFNHWSSHNVEPETAPVGTDCMVEDLPLINMLSQALQYRTSDWNRCHSCQFDRSNPQPEHDLPLVRQTDHHSFEAIHSSMTTNPSPLVL